MPMQKLQRTIYTARVHTTGGRENGHSRSENGNLDVDLSPPGTTGKGTNPEQLFAAGYSACFIGAMKAVAPKMGITVPDDVSIDADVFLGPVPDAYGIAVRMQVSLPGMDKQEAQRLLDAAHKVCPYSNAVRDNINVRIELY